MTIRRSQDGAAGFTLLELMVALAILGLVSLMLFGGLRFGLNAWTRESAHANAVSDIGVAQGFLRRAIGEAYPLFQVDGEDKRVNPFVGSRRALEFLAPTPASLGSGGRQRYSIGTETAGARTDLVIWSQPELAADPAKRWKTILVPGIRTLSIDYFGRQGDEEEAHWHDAWQDASHLPELVRLQVAFAADDFRTWPEFVVAPRIAVDANCVYDPLTHGCKGR
ncbi:general secretion pathway protein GspJ [Aliidongia dinghuensis]|uniref:General secretion pathway protein GspJ n=1 Tax=Aliidongia dinghuensis TaxID=1867774 RepID=A0A8J2Z1D1_9PROT|nr:prepilin-type N-terminal cleavage/methylation domain-containing protein [Aliidongia dinghuensis]GGF51443.1 general secretion pathway protein GspJ [Aliidongia dinghuensis]